VEAPLVVLPGTAAQPAVTITAHREDLPLRQEFTAGTTAHAVSMGRRQVVEKVNADLKGSFVDIGDRFFTQVLGLTKRT
jgi:hypothetical protein